MIYLKRPLRWLFCLFFIGITGGCTTLPLNHFLPKNLQLAPQSPMQFADYEILVNQINQALQLKNLKANDKASLLFERGVLNDSLGVWTLARNDFIQSILLRPRNVAAYNYLGLYAFLDNDIDSALDGFNAVFELDPNYEYTYLNRGLVFYYTGRSYLAQKDLLKFYQADRNDPFRILWLYLNEFKDNSQVAKTNLIERSKSLKLDSLGYRIIQYYLGNVSLVDVLTQINEKKYELPSQYAEELTEAYFYIAKHQLNAGQKEQAKTLFKLAIANRVYNFVEYRFALLELDKLNSKQ